MSRGCHHHPDHHHRSRRRRRLLLVNGDGILLRVLRSRPLPHDGIAALVSASGWAALCALLVAAGACRAQRESPAPAGSFADSFNRKEPGDDWRDTGGGYGISDGKLVARNAYNHPIWLRRPLPRDAVIEVDVQSHSDAGDIKLELYGDGESFDPDRGGYVSTGYVLIFGGWHNSLSVICRNNEHDEGRKSSRNDIPVQRGRTYHFAITRRGGLLDWRIDNQPFLSWTDPEALAGRGHQFLALNDWEAEVLFDNLSVTPAR